SVGLEDRSNAGHMNARNESVRNKMKRATATKYKGVDAALQYIVKPFGVWQVLLTCFCTLSLSSMEMLSIFGIGDPLVRCQMEPQWEERLVQLNYSFEQASHFIQGDKGSQCERLANFSDSANSSGYEACPLGYVLRPLLTQMPETLTEEFNLVCDRKWIQTIVFTSFMIGMVLGFPTGGAVADAYGRRMTFIVTSVLVSLVTASLAFAPYISVFIGLYCALGFLDAIKVTLIFLIVFELTTARFRPLASFLIVVHMYFINRSLAILLAYVTMNWRYLCGAIAGVTCTAGLAALLLPESPRWLISQHRYQLAVKMLRRSFRFNHFGRRPNQGQQTMLEEFASVYAAESKPPRQPFSLLFQDKRLLRITVLGSLIFMAHIVVYFGILMYTKEVQYSVFLATFIQAASCIPGTTLAMALYSHFRSVHSA
ncbi:hypothetical protein Ciccas_014173, partial [Cichlidogyrus casuarinus]